MTDNGARDKDQGVDYNVWNEPVHETFIIEIIDRKNQYYEYEICEQAKDYKGHVKVVKTLSPKHSGTIKEHEKACGRGKWHPYPLALEDVINGSC